VTYSEAWKYLTSIGWSLSKQFGSVRIGAGWWQQVTANVRKIEAEPQTKPAFKGCPLVTYATFQTDAYNSGYHAWRRMLKVLATAERMKY
jgi:hypothetical protein